MRNILCFTLLLLLASVTPASAAIVNDITVDFAQTTAVTATFDHNSSVINWSGGGTAVFNTDMGAVGINSFSGSFLGVTFGIDMTASFSNMTNTSSGGLASASFDTGSFNLSVTANGSPIASLAGIVTPNATGYNEDEELTNQDQLTGGAVVTIQSFGFDAQFFEDYLTLFEGFGGSLNAVDWIDGQNSLGGLISDISLPTNSGFDDYGTQSYSGSAIITITADETAIPEPATMVLLGLGSLGLTRMRKRHN